MVGDTDIDRMTNLQAVKSFLDSRGALVQLVTADPNIEIQGCCLELLRRHGQENPRIKLTKFDLNEARSTTPLTIRPQAVSFVTPSVRLTDRRQTTEAVTGTSLRARALGGTDARVTHESLTDELGRARDVQAKNSRVLKIQTSNIEDLVKQNEERRAQRTREL